MTFLGLEFFLFFTAVILIGYLLPPFYRNLFLLAASYLFYCTWQPVYLIVLILATVLDFVLALKMDPLEPSKKKRVLLAGIIINIALLAFFKYFTFLSDFLRSIIGIFGIDYAPPGLNLAMPLGISYYLFKKISYLTDVYRKKLAPERNFVSLALYVSFFPQIIAGPIDRAKSLLSQFMEKSKPQWTQMLEGIQMIGWGLFKKLVIADRLGLMVERVFNYPEGYQAPVIILAVIFYAFQIYCDFSGYSDIAIGLGRLLGFKLMDNFSQPYLAVSISQFWQRWHISLSTWLRDYLFLPISYSLMRKLDRKPVTKIRVEVWAYLGGVTVTMLICGLWHGAGWTFVFWGFLHGLYLMISFITKKSRKRINRYLRLTRYIRLRKFIRGMITFMLVSFAWIFFRAESMGAAFSILGRIIGTTPGVNPAGLFHSRIGGLSAPNFWIAIFALAVLIWVELGLEKKTLYRLVVEKPILVRWGIYYLIIFSILVFGIYQQQEFIYGQF